MNGTISVKIVECYVLTGEKQSAGSKTCPIAGAHPEFFLWGSEPEAVYNLCLI
jgi:hypothetical protein